MKIQKTLAIVVALALTTAIISGCNTMKGVGRDVEGGGASIEKTADKTQDKIEEKKAEHRANVKAEKKRNSN